MRRIISIFVVSILLTAFANGQQNSTGESKYLLGFSGILPTGTWPSTALSNMGYSSFLSDQGHTVKSYGLGIILQRKITDHISIFLDMNIYDYNIFLAHQGDDVQTSWTESEGALHWDEPGAPQILYVHNLPTDVHFDMKTSGMRAGARYFFLTDRFRPWVGAGFGYYVWNADYVNGNKTKTYGSDKGSATGFTFQGGVDFEVMQGIVLTAFADAASPVAHYQMEGLFYDQWNIDWQCPVMGPARFGITLSVSPSGHKRKGQ
jgi:hypothetical protein